MESQFL